MDIADVGGIENPAAVNGIEGKAMSIEFDSPREERIKALIVKDLNIITNAAHIDHERKTYGVTVDQLDLALDNFIREAVALGEDLKQEELVCSGCRRKQDLPWYCKDCENKENKVGGGGGSILPLDRIGNDVWHRPRRVNQNGSEG